MCITVKANKIEMMHIKLFSLMALLYKFYKPTEIGPITSQDSKILLAPSGNSDPCSISSKFSLFINFDDKHNLKSFAFHHLFYF
jgi:hypothetical protein